MGVENGPFIGDSMGRTESTPEEAAAAAEKLDQAQKEEQAAMEKAGIHYKPNKIKLEDGTEVEAGGQMVDGEGNLLNDDPGNMAYDAPPPPPEEK